VTKLDANNHERDDEDNDLFPRCELKSTVSSPVPVITLTQKRASMYLVINAPLDAERMYSMRQ